MDSAHLRQAAAAWFTWSVAMKKCGLCVISVFYFLKEVRNLDFYMSFLSFFFFPALTQTSAFCNFIRQYVIFSQETLPSILSPLTHLWEQEVHMLMQIKRRRSGAGDIPWG